MKGLSERAALDALGVAYRVELDREAWLRELIDRIGPALDSGAGVMAWTYALTETGAFRYTSEVVATDGVTPEGIETCIATNERLTPEEVAASFRTERVLDSAGRAMRAAFGIAFDDWPGFDRARSLGYRDCLVAKALDPSGVGVMLAAPLPAVDEGPWPGASRWAKVMAHVLAGLRLRSTSERATEAMVDSSGRVVHAEGAAQSRSARANLRDAALCIDRARSKRGHEDPERAVEAWRALVSGRWSLVDQFDSDGRRFLVAKPNDPEIAAWRKLTRRERQVAAYAALGHSNKHIAYALGLSPSTVSSHLVRAMQRLGVRDRTVLAALMVQGAT